jgi:hypothetical protein
MSQYIEGTISTTEDSTLIQGDTTPGLIDWSSIIQGMILIVGDDTVGYEVASVDNDLKQITLAAPYYATKADENYVLIRDFTYNGNLPLINQGDAKTAVAVSRAFNIIDQHLQGGLVFRGDFADYATLVSSVTDPAVGNYAYVSDTGDIYFYTGSWRVWDISGITQGPTGPAGFTPTFDWTSGTWLFWTLPGGGTSTPVNLKGEKGETGGLHFAGSWGSGVTYYVDECVNYGSKSYVALDTTTGDQPDVSPTKWAEFPISPATSNTSASVDGTFVNADLVAGILTVAHGIGSQAVEVTVYNDSWKIIGPTDVTAIDASTVDIDISDFGTISGTWRYVITGKLP